MSSFFEKVSSIIRREILRDPFLLEAKRWFKDDGDNNLRLQYPLNEKSVVWDLGGYKGDFAEKIYDRYKCKVYLFEPVPEFYKYCVEKFESNSQVTCYMYGLSDTEGRFLVSFEGDSSSFVRKERKSIDNVEAKLRAINDVLVEFNIDTVDLLKINIEGGEYDVLPALINSGNIEKIEYLQVQFHNFIPEADKKRNNIRHELSKTHYELWNYPFVWECWKKKAN